MSREFKLSLNLHAAFRCLRALVACGALGCGKGTSTVASDAALDLIDSGHIPIDAAVPDASDHPPCAKCLPIPGRTGVPLVPSLGVEHSIRWSKQLLYESLRGKPVLSRDRFVVAAADRLFFVNIDSGAIEHSFRSANLEQISAPVADSAGAVFFFGNYAYAVNPDGSPRWQRAHGQTGSVVGAPALSPSGTLLVPTESKAVVARSTTTGDVLWSRSGDVGVFEAIGVGDMATDLRYPGYWSEAFSAVDGGTIDCAYTSSTRSRYHRFVAFGGEVLQQSVGDGSYLNHRIDYVDSCHRLLWTQAERTAQAAALVLPEERLLIEDYLPEEGVAELRTISKEGVTVGPVVKTGRPILVGADGITYVAKCKKDDAYAESEIIALRPDLTEAWRVQIGGCPMSGVLHDSGLLILAWQGIRDDNRGVNVTAVQTSSPGLADTEWPVVLGRDNQSSNWAQ